MDTGRIKEITGEEPAVLNRVGDKDIRYVIVDGAAAVETWHKLHAARSDIGAAPIMMGRIEPTPDWVEALSEAQKYAPAARMLTEAKALDGKAWLARQAAEFEGEEDEDEDDEMLAHMGPPATAEQNMVAKPTVPLGEGEACLVALVPTVEAAEAACWLGFGGFNACPMPSEQTAVMRYWAEAYGAVVCSITNDIVECYVERPPESEADARALADEQYAFCDDLVDQGYVTRERLTQALVKRPYWYFWWD